MPEEPEPTPGVVCPIGSVGVPVVPVSPIAIVANNPIQANVTSVMRTFLIENLLSLGIGIRKRKKPSFMPGSLRSGLFLRLLDIK
jgi:hypothetical protein